ncbi:MAG: DUF1844 domain-containing protein [Planctomycetia bacterium]|nr:DUF1844 domain-containing protein [Planctomycetia bacterium]
MSDQPHEQDDRAAPGGAAPPASFEFLVQTLFTQALMALGRLPNPITKQSIRNPATARHFVETLAMLERKTEGNRTAEESRLLEEILHQLRLLCIADDGSPMTKAAP